MEMRLDRREFLKLSGSGVVAASLLSGGASFTFAKKMEELNLPKPSKNSPRVVIVGAGWSGLTIAKYIKMGNPNVEVVLIDKRHEFFSCPVSNLWLVDLVNLEFLMHDFLTPAARHGYHILTGTSVIDVDRSARKVYTDKGVLSYDYLVLAPGIDYHYESWIKDPKEIELAQVRYPAGFIPASEHIRIKEKIQNFEKGTFVLTVPPGLDYRCMPAPYERATLIAWYFKKNNINGKVVLVDNHPDPPVKAKGFHYAWDNIVKGYVEYYPNAGIKSVDVNKRRISTEAYGDIDFDDGAIYPLCKAGEIVFKAGLVKKGERWPDIDPLKYHAVGDERVYVTGDARSQPFSKSGNTSNTEAHYIAKLILAKIAGKEIAYEPPRTLCYSAVAPQEAIWIDLTYKYLGNGKFEFANVKLDEQPKESNYKAYIEWAKGLYRDMFA
ncbi:FAD/NAD(P)-binding oxidoreductase [Hydrogenobacter thermophilus]|uniref:NAD(P)/FAD-dependent oxidoreductase n=1 Tax=Hydrogenobacter thermophilus TaxID=940 RepID=UPI0026F1F02F|nr:FAD/NAD(P)-binding oxidoreductase [Hydrogenobacter thermophilus]